MSNTLEARAGAESLLTGRYAPVVLLSAVLVIYLPSLGGGFLNLDDPWLIGENSIIRSGWSGFAAIWTDLSRPTRLVLGAEYLPIRDSSHWLEFHAFGLQPRPMRIVNLGFYLGAVLLFRAALRRALGGGVAPEVATWLFAVHPVHVESVAWLAGRKDVLAMLFVAAALRVHAGESKHRPWAVALLMLLAVLSKAMAVAGLGLMLAIDLLARQKPNRLIYATTASVVAVPMVAHFQVGDVVSMTTAPFGGTRSAAAAAMGETWLDYAQSVVLPGALSIVHDPPDDPSWGLSAAAGWSLVLVWGLVGFRLARPKREGETEGKPLVLAAWIFWIVPLLPVSQVLVPLENFQADRYLFLSIMGPALLLGGFMDMMGDRRAIGATLVVAGALGLFAWHRADLFADSVKVFRDATDKTEVSPKAPYQLGAAYEARGDDELAVKAYREVLARAPGSQEEARRATNNLARSLARLGRLRHAERVLERGRGLWPRDPKILGNLAEIVARQPGREAEGRELYLELLRDFPEYEFGRRSYGRRYGPVPARP